MTAIETAPAGAPDSGSAKRITAVGAVLLVLGAVCWFLHVYTAANGTHSWQDGDPPDAVTLRAGHVYHLSSRDGTGGAVAVDCMYIGASGSPVSLPVTPVAYDARILHRIGSFVAPEIDPLAITCPSVGAVYVDDATNADFDISGLLVVPTVLFGLAGVVLVLVGASRMEEQYRDEEDAGDGLGADDPLGWGDPAAAGPSADAASPGWPGPTHGYEA